MVDKGMMEAAVLEREAVVKSSDRRALYEFQERLRGDLEVIYVLCDPDTCIWRYVGQTTYPLAYRLSDHIRCAINAAEGKVKDTYNYRWIRSVLRSGKEPIIQILDLVPADDLDEAEIFWIRTLRDMGFQLTNTGDGGAGPRGRKCTEDEIARRVETNIKAYWSSPERQQRRRDAMKGRRPPVRRGEDNNRASLTDEVVLRLRREAKALPEKAFTDFATDLGVSRCAVTGAITGETWAHLNDIEAPVPRDSKSKRRPANDPIDIEGIRDALNGTESGRSIAKRFRVSDSYVSGIKHGKLHPINVVGDPGATKEVVSSL